MTGATTEPYTDETNPKREGTVQQWILRLEILSLGNASLLDTALMLAPASMIT